MYTPSRASSVLQVLYSVHCTLHTVQCTLYTAYDTVYAVHCTLYTAHCTHCTLYTVHHITCLHCPPGAGQRGRHGDRAGARPRRAAQCGGPLLPGGHQATALILSFFTPSPNCCPASRISGSSPCTAAPSTTRDTSMASPPSTGQGVRSD